MCRECLPQTTPPQYLLTNEANGFPFQLEEKSPPRLVALRKGEFIEPAQSHKGGKGPQEVSGLTHIAEKGELWMQTMSYRALPSWVSKTLNNTCSPTFLGDLFKHSIISLKYFFHYIQSESNLGFGSLLGFISCLMYMQMYMHVHFCWCSAETAAAKGGSMKSASWTSKGSTVFSSFGSEEHCQVTFPLRISLTCPLLICLNDKPENLEKACLKWACAKTL